MTLPVQPPFSPMEALSVGAVPKGSEWQYEPKWDGFRCVAFRDGAKVQLQSKGEKDLSRYFPELVASLRSLKAKKFVMDGEIIIPIGRSLSFDALLQRIHPAKSRVERLAEETPAKFMVFDILVDDSGRDLTATPLRDRRKKLESFAKKYFTRKSGLLLSPATTKLSQTQAWAKKARDALDGIIAKRLDAPYRSGERDGMQKIKTIRTADCVVGGFRYASSGKVVGSLLLGLYDEKGVLNHVGFVATTGQLGTKALTKKLEKLIGPPGFTGRAPGGPSRWSTERSTKWEPLKPKLVVEVAYDHFTGGRFRHGTRFVRWRPDKAPSQCKKKQAARESGLPLLLVQ